MTPSTLSTSAPLRRRLEALLALQGRTEHDAAAQAGIACTVALWRTVGIVEHGHGHDPDERERMRVRMAGAFRVSSYSFTVARIMAGELFRAWELAGVMRDGEQRQAEAVRILTESTQQPDTGG